MIANHFTQIKICPQRTLASWPLQRHVMNVDNRTLVEKKHITIGSPSCIPYFKKKFASLLSHTIDCQSSLKVATDKLSAASKN